MSKVCSKCKEEKSLSSFYREKHGKYGVGSVCKECKKIVHQEWYYSNKAEIAKRNKELRNKERERFHSYKLKNRYGISLDEALEILDEQGNLCAICQDEIEIATGENRSSACIDHCHSSSKVRGIICNSCNLMLGYSRDDPEILEKAIEYLTDDSTSNV